MPDLALILSNIALPLCAGVTFFALARYSSHIAPMRFLVTGEITYKGAAWGFAFFGAYLITRPLEVLLGPLGAVDDAEQHAGERRKRRLGGHDGHHDAEGGGEVCARNDR